jgi:hypothetical protein
MRLVPLSGVALGLGLLVGCADCERFGPIPLEIHLEPPVVRATVTVCEADDGVMFCKELPSPPTEKGTVYDAVSWDGRTNSCRFPALEIDVEAPGCAPEHVSVPEQEPVLPARLRVDIALDCEG